MLSKLQIAPLPVNIVRLHYKLRMSGFNRRGYRRRAHLPGNQSARQRSDGEKVFYIILPRKEVRLNEYTKQYAGHACIPEQSYTA